VVKPLNMFLIEYFRWSKHLEGLWWRWRNSCRCL